MEYKTYWEILEIEPTTDRIAIKKAYAKLSKKYHPEQYPQEFKQLQNAYKSAIAYSKNSTSTLQLDQIQNELNSYFQMNNNQEQDINNESKQKGYDSGIDNIKVNVSFNKKNTNTVDIEKNSSKNEKQFLVECFKKMLNKSCDIDTLENILMNKRIRAYLKDDKFKGKIEQLIIDKIPYMDAKTKGYITRVSYFYGFSRIELLTKKSDQPSGIWLILALGIMALLILISGFDNTSSSEGLNLGATNADKQQLEESIEQSELSKLRKQIAQEEEMKKINELHAPYLSGVRVALEEDGYMLYDQDEQLLPINYEELHFTTTNYLLLKDEGIYEVFNCSERKLLPKPYMKGYVLEVLSDTTLSQSDIDKCIVVSDREKTWLFDPNGNRIELDTLTSVDDKTQRIYMNDGEVTIAL